MPESAASEVVNALIADCDAGAAGHDENRKTATTTIQYGRYESGHENRNMHISYRNGVVIGVAARMWTDGAYQWAVADWTACWTDLGSGSRRVVPHPRTIYHWDDSYGQRLFVPGEGEARKLLAALAAAGT